ncbi:MAG: hypothetical protein WBB36_14135, partial [Chitinophagales bacterium]
TNSENTTGKVILRAAGTNTLYVSSNGTVGIGTDDTKGYKLGVDGGIICEELKVKNSTNWPDYVFEKDYQLKDIDEMQSFIKCNNHLPGIPSAAEMNEKGIDVGEMQKMLLQKVEELSLYVISLKEQNDLLNAKVEQLNKN